jgi:zinc/manganese transport system substrate-binding protein
MNKLLKCFFALMLSGAPWAAHAALNVVTSTEDLAALTLTIGGDAVKVKPLTRGTADPHFAQAKPSMIREVYQADLLVVVGAELEVGWMPALLQAARNVRVQPGNPGYLDLSTAVTLLDKPSGPVTRDMGDVHAAGNPHYWLDPNNGVLMARAIAQRLTQLDGAHANDFQRALASFEQQAQVKIAAWKTALAPLAGKAVMSYHTSFVYLAHAFGFQIAAEIEPKPGISPSAAYLTQLIARIKEQHIGVLIMEPYYERRSAAYLSEHTGVRVAVLPQSVGATEQIKTYFDLFDGIVAAFKQAGTL